MNVGIVDVEYDSLASPEMTPAENCTKDGIQLLEINECVAVAPRNPGSKPEFAEVAAQTLSAASVGIYVNDS